MNTNSTVVAWKGFVFSLLFVTVGFARAADETATNSPGTNNQPWDKGSITFGGLVSAFDSTVQFSTKSATGVTINAEELLGLDTTLVVFRADAMYRPGQSLRNQLDFTYAGFHRSGSAILGQAITIGGVTLPIGASTETTFNFDIIRGTYSYALLQDDRMRIALGAGVYVVPLKVSLNATTTTGNQFINGANTTLPLPAIALRTDFLLVPKLYLNASIDAMYLEIGDFKGSLVDVNAGLEYRPWKHFGIGVGYSALSVDVEAQGTSTDFPGANFFGKVDVHYSGLMLYGKVAF